MITKQPYGQIGRLISTLAITTFFASSVLGQAPADVPQEVLINYSLAAESFKNKDYVSAAPYFRWLLNNAPTTYNGERLHRRAVETYEALADTADTAELKKAYLDSALVVLGSAVETLKGDSKPVNEAQWSLDQGYFIQNRKDVYPELQDTYVDHYRTAFDLDPESFEAYYATSTAREYARQGRKQEAVDFMEVAEPHFKDNADVVDYFNTIRNSLFRNPAERVAFLESQLEKSPDDLEIIKELFELYRNLDETEKMQSIGAQLLTMEPDATTYRLIAEVKYQNGENEEALDLYAKALELADPEDTDLKRDINYNVALVHYGNGSLRSARSAARAALQIDNSFGRAYMLIGDIYAGAVQDSAFEREDKAVYWLVVDYYERAAAKDASLKSVASQKASSYRGVFPTTDEKFFKGWKSGQSYKVDYGRYAWIGETTKVR